MAQWTKGGQKSSLLCDHLFRKEEEIQLLPSQSPPKLHLLVDCLPKVDEKRCLVNRFLDETIRAKVGEQWPEKEEKATLQIAAKEE